MQPKTVATKKILVIEDDASVRQLMAKHFRRQGYDVSEAEDAAAAMTKAKSGSTFDLILTDVHLPDDSGVHLARLIHAEAPLSPIIFVTGDPDAQMAREALETEGAAGYLVKPFRLFELDAVVDGVLSRTDANQIIAEDLAERPQNRINHLFDALDVGALEADEAVAALSAERAAALQAVLDAGDAYDVVEPRYRLRLNSDNPQMLEGLPRPRLNLRQLVVLAVVILLGVLFAIGLPGSNASRSGVILTTPSAAPQ
jgi:DNA-binding response OmpR family regulator